jgi:hypothetical protein
MPKVIPDKVDDPLPPTLGLPIEARIELAQEAHRQGRFPDSYFIALMGVHPFQAWRQLGYAVFIDARRAGAFKEALKAGKPWLGRSDLLQGTPEAHLKREWDSFGPDRYHLADGRSEGNS